MTRASSRAPASLPPERVLVVSHTTGYQLRAFDEAAARIGVELVFATDRCHELDDPWHDRAIAVRFYDLPGSVEAIRSNLAGRPVAGVIAVGDRPVVLASRAAEALNLPWHSPDGARASTDKRRLRSALAAAGLPSPAFSVLSLSPVPSASTTPLPFPVVLKPVGLSGSRGVIRANDAREFQAAFERIRALLDRPQIRSARAGLEDEMLVEAYVDGPEYAVEGVLTRGALQTFAIFDKPDPLEGPFFEETIYVTPSGLPRQMQQRLGEAVQRAAAVLGLRHGPIHAECRVAADEVYVLEMAGRPIGGLCSRAVSLVRTAGAAAGREEGRASLEDVLLRHATGESIEGWARERAAAAVMMIPIPARGMLKGVSGEDAARAVPGVTDVRVTAKIGQILEPLPEAGSYLGFIFARAETPRAAERAVRGAHATLAFDIARDIAVEQA